MNRTVFSRPGATDTSLTQKIRVTGVVQGVGFRPFVYRLARELGLTGYVCNDAAGVDIVVQGRAGQVRLFLERLSAEAPAVSHIRSIDAATVPAIDAANFAIRESGTGDTVRTMVPADLAVCDDCLAEMHDPADRRYRYPFINCTNCGPRFSITEELPYDRATTSMADFEMCPACNREYRDPENRRFHAEPISCWDCGPRYVLHDGRHVVASTDPVGDAATLLRDGRILAIKGVGGFHLAVDASNAGAVATLRERKGRPDKPLALMAGDLDTIRKHAEVSDPAEASLLAPDRPIVLLNRRTPGSIDSSIAGDIGTLGFMLPYAPVHYLLLCDDLPLLVMTSGNLAGEPLAADNDEALTSLGGIADWFLLHNRRIVHRNDDSVGREYLGDMRVVRRSRGAVPNAIRLTRPVGRPILACGADLKSAVGLAREDEFYFSQHLGELETAAGYDFYDAAISDLLQLTGTTPELVACDMHPDYLSSRWARQHGKPPIKVQHHHAHMVSVMAENQVEEGCLGIILDGTGYGPDGTIWGGEFLAGDALRYERVAHLRPVPMPGGAEAIRHPWRMAVSWVRQAFGGIERVAGLDVCKRQPEGAISLIDRMIDTGLHTPLTSSCGRLFDAVAAILGLGDSVSYEAQAAIRLEAIADRDSDDLIEPDGPESIGPCLDPGYLIRAVVEEQAGGLNPARIAGRFHRSLATLLVHAAKMICDRRGLDTVALSGGVYQNHYFFELMVSGLESAGLSALTHHKVPCNDGGLALGQAIIAARQARR